MDFVDQMGPPPPPQLENQQASESAVNEQNISPQQICHSQNPRTPPFHHSDPYFNTSQGQISGQVHSFEHDGYQSQQTYGNQGNQTFQARSDLQQNQIPKRMSNASIGYPSYQNGHRSNGSVTRFIPAGISPSMHTAAINQIHINPAVGKFTPASFNVPPHARPDAYEELTKEGIPDPYLLLEEYFPFQSPSADKKGSTSGVIKILNTPYDVTKNEIVAMLGRDAKITTYPSSSSYYGIHIMFDRSTGKSGEVMVELQSDEEAQTVFKSLEKYSRRTGKPRMCGNRVTQIQVVGQEELMALLFPKAKCCGWIGQVAHIRNPGEHESAFEGFITNEELRQLAAHAQKPGKGQFGKNAPQRPYEALISVLQKLPWHQSNLITLAERDNMFHVCRDMVGTLVRQIRSEKRYGSGGFGIKLNQQLLNELVVVSCSEAIFNPAQQRALLDITRNGENDVQFPLPRLADWWPFEVLSFKQGLNEKLLEYYAMLMKQSSTSPEVNTPEELIQVRQMVHNYEILPFGAFVMAYDDNKWHVDCSDIARMEEEIVTFLIRRLMNKAADEEIAIPDCHNTPEPHAGPLNMVVYPNQHDEEQLDVEGYGEGQEHGFEQNNLDQQHH